jgi:hypothetical protein
MGYAQKLYGRAAQIWPSRKRETGNELEVLREENKQLRETVAHLSELVLTQIAGVTEPKEQSANCRRLKLKRKFSLSLSATEKSGRAVSPSDSLR